MTTLLFAGTFVVLQFAQWFLTAVCLYFGSRWARIPGVSCLRAVATTMAILAVDVVCWGLAMMLDWLGNSAGWHTNYVMCNLVSLALGVLPLNWLIVAIVFRAKFGRAILAWLPTLIPPAVFWVLAVFAVRPYLFEAFYIPTNGMAPTILGRHWEAPCPRCGSPAFASPEPEPLRPFLHPVMMVCSREYRAVEVSDPPRVELPGDRIVVSKLIAPRRWDLIVFSFPENPETKFCMRLVGLPNETVVLREGAVWANGEKQTPPNESAALHYLSELDGLRRALWGSETKPARLGPDEYFVLGDFSARSKDSRLWVQGAPGHPPYAMPASYIVGVATHIYWPPNRCRVLR